MIVINISATGDVDISKNLIVGNNLIVGGNITSTREVNINNKIKIDSSGNIKLGNNFIIENNGNVTINGVIKLNNTNIADISQNILLGSTYNVKDGIMYHLGRNIKYSQIGCTLVNGVHQTGYTHANLPAGLYDMRPEMTDMGITPGYGNSYKERVNDGIDYIIVYPGFRILAWQNGVYTSDGDKLTITNDSPYPVTYSCERHQFEDDIKNNVGGNLYHNKGVVFNDNPIITTDINTSDTTKLVYMSGKMDTKQLSAILVTPIIKITDV